MNYNFFKKLAHYITYLFVILLSLPAQAQLLTGNGKTDVTNNMKGTGEAANYNTSWNASNPQISNVATTVINAFLGLLGIIFLIMILIGGYNWMTAAGDESKVENAKKTLQRGVIGLLIIAAAYSITAFVFRSLSGVIGRPG